jgi:hypothetical protein
MAGLGRRVHHHRRTKLADQAFDPRPVLDVQLVMPEPGMRREQPLLVPARVSRRPEEIRGMLLSIPCTSRPRRQK